MPSSLVRRALAGSAALVVLPAPALADHGIAGAGTSGSGPILTIPAETLPEGSWAAGMRVTLARPDGYSDAELIDLAGRHVHAHTTDYNLSGTASVAYGLSDHLTLAASLPYIRRDDLREGEHSHSGGVTTNSVVDQGSIDGIGDLSLLAQYQVAHSHEGGWGVALLAGLKLPTGATHEKTPDGERFETEHQPGTGSWDPLIGLAASKRWGAVAFDSSLLYQASTRGAQRTELGDRATLNLALSYALGAHHHEHDGDVEDGHSHGGAWSLMVEANGEWEGKQRIAGDAEDESGARVVYLSPGARFTTAEWSAAVSLGIPVWQDVGRSHPDNRVRLIAGLSKAF